MELVLVISAKKDNNIGIFCKILKPDTGQLPYMQYSLIENISVHLSIMKQQMAKLALVHKQNLSS